MARWKLGARWMLAGMLLVTVSAHAIPIPFKRGTTETQTEGKSLREFLPDFFHEQGLEVVLSSQVAARGGSINGSFKGSYAQIWRKIADTNGLSAYWDGSAVYVYLNNERITDYTSIPLASEQKFMAAMDSVKWADAATGNVWRMEQSSGLVTITGTRRFAEQVKQMAQTIVGLGQNVNTQFKFYPLKYAWASDTTMTVGGRQVTIAGVASVLRDLVGEVDSGQFAGARERILPSRQQSLRGQGLASVGQQPPPPLGNYTAPLQQEGDDGLSPPTAQLAPGGQGGNGVETIQGAGDTRIVADSFRNAIIVRDTPDRMPMYDSLIRQLDVQPQMVEIEATIIDVDKQKVRQLGINWLYHNRGTTVGFQSGNANVADALSNQALMLAALGARDTSALPNIFANGLQIGAILGNPAHFVASIDALEDDGVTHVITRPQVITVNDAEAVIQSNQTVYVPVAGAYNSDLYNVVAGTTLRVTPHVVDENGELHIRMQVNIEDGNITFTAKDSQKISYPIVNQNAVNTTAIIRDGQGLLLGGLIQDQGSNMEHKIPVLGDIPLLGYLFKSVQKQRQHTERLFLITPRLVAMNHITGQQSPTASGVSVESQQQLDRQEASRNAWWNYKGDKVTQPTPSPDPLPAQPPVAMPSPPVPSRH
ncbi:type III secretion system outer membrane ring subunit SctC [Dyella sp.]|uniref:type III secretion system outer membrane ring subunit SctC n=1 Tax=Dyella sp. TaxID=1869338 RepID=UPI002ED464C3